MLYYHVTTILRPFTLIVLVLIVAQILLWRNQAPRGRRLFWISLPIVALYLYSTPAVAYLMLGTLEWRYPPSPTARDPAQAIVVLSGGLKPPDSVRKKARLDCSSVVRCLHAAEVYHAGPQRTVLLSGGKVFADRPGPFLSEAMRDLLIQLGVPDDDILLETQSRSTHENALYSARLLRDHNMDTAILVTDATHLDRSARCFEAQGIRVTPAGARYRATEFQWRFADFLPTSGAVAANEDVFHEWLGLLWYRLKGHI